MKKMLFTLLSSLMLVSFDSNAQCSTPANLTASYSNNVSTFNWDPVPGATSYDFEIDWAGSYWSFGIIPVANPPYQLTGLMQGGAYQWRVTANCGTPSAPSATTFFNTPCLEPFNLSATSITTNSAVLNWQQSSTINNINTGFSVSYRLANTNNAWIQLTNIYNNPTATNFNLTGLAPGTAYEWRVKRVCSFCNSTYLNSTFVTLACIPSGINNTEWISLFSLGTINRPSSYETGGYINTQIGTNLTIGSNNSGQIRAGYTGNWKNQRFSVYIDFNRNGSFNDAGEQLVSTSNINNPNIKSFNIAIPNTATPGPTRMRVIMRRSSGQITSCVTGYYGEAEDYNVDLVASSSKNSVAVEMNSTIPKASATILAGLTVNPNPSNGVFLIKLPKTSTADSYEIINTSGQILQQSKIVPASSIEININNAPAGMYILNIRCKDGKKLTQKLQKI